MKYFLSFTSFLIPQILVEFLHIERAFCIWSVGFDVSSQETEILDIQFLPKK